MHAIGMFALVLAIGCASSQTKGDAAAGPGGGQTDASSWTDKGSWFEVDGDNVWMCAVGVTPAGAPESITLMKGLAELAKFARVTITQREWPGGTTISTDASASFASNDPRTYECKSGTCYKMVCTNLADSRAKPGFKMFAGLSVEENAALLDALIAHGRTAAD